LVKPIDQNGFSTKNLSAYREVLKVLTNNNAYVHLGDIFKTYVRRCLW